MNEARIYIHTEHVILCGSTMDLKKKEEWEKRRVGKK